MKTIMPIQPIKKDDKGVVRFVPNRIVEKLLETSSLDLNDIAIMDFTEQEHMQLAQLIGYSLSGFGGLSYVDDETFDAAERIALRGLSEAEARSAALREQIEEARDGVKQAAVALFQIHPDDMEA